MTDRCKWCKSSLPDGNENCINCFPEPSGVVDITVISDLHGDYPRLEGGDLLIVAGDLATDSHKTINLFKDWMILNAGLYQKVVYIAGNHDNWIQEGVFFNRMAREWGLSKICYLEDSGTEFEGNVKVGPNRDMNFPDAFPSGNNVPSFNYVVRKLKIWGSPWTKTFPGMNPKCKAFTVDTDEELAEKWALIPKDTDVLITHCPPYGMMDEIEDKTKKGTRKVHVGSKSLTARIHELELSLHVFGHVHEGYGHEVVSIPSVSHMGFANMHVVNASHVNEKYEPVNKPIRVML